MDDSQTLQGSKLWDLKYHLFAKYSFENKCRVRETAETEPRLMRMIHSNIPFLNGHHCHFKAL